MKGLSNLLHRVTWPILIGGGILVFVALAIFTAPLHTIRLEKSGATPEENRAIKSEINSAFSEGVIDVARDIVKEVHDRTRDPERREELERALADIDQARDSLRETGVELMRAKRDAIEQVDTATRDAAAAIAEAKKQAAIALKDAPQENARIQKSLDESLDAAKKADADSRQAIAESTSAKIRKPRVVVMGPVPGDAPLLDLEVGKDGIAAPAAPLTPQVRQEIRRKITGDLYRVGVGASLILVFIPLFILTIVSKYFIDRSRAAQEVADMKRKEAEYHRMSRQVTEAKLSALQAQVEPHFLYNTLASVQALTEVDPSKANAMTGHLIQYLRNALPKMREAGSTVGQEVELVRAYLNILQMRMGKRLAFEIDVPAELADTPFPPLMLPSLVENAIKHGLEPQREGGTVVIRATRSEDRVRLTVADTGRGFGDTPGSGVGLANIRERLAALYGAAAKLTLESQEPHGVVATLDVPVRGREPGPAGAAADPAAFALPTTPAAPQSATARTLAAMGTAERAWRKGLSFAFIVLVCCAAVLCGLAMVAVATGFMPVQLGDAAITGPTGALIGTAGIAAAFSVIVLALAIVLAVVYGLGFLFVGLAIFVPLVIVVSLVPALAPFILVGLAIWWFVRRSRRRKAAAAAAAVSSPPQEVR